MKTERRHELQKNELAFWIEKQIDGLRPYFGMIGVVAIVVVGVTVPAYLWLHRGSVEKNAAWRDFFSAENARKVEDLYGVADDHKGSQAGLWALQRAADLQLGKGSGLAYRDRKAAKKELGKAVDNYRAVLDGAEEKSMLRRRALLGLAQAYELLGQVDQARKRYKQLVELCPKDDQGQPKTTLGKHARQRWDDLGRESTRAWLAWYAQKDPKTYLPRTPPTLPSGKPPRAPRPYDDLYDDPELSLPGPDDLAQLPAGPPADESQSPKADDLKVPDLTPSIPGDLDPDAADDAGRP